MRSSASSRIGKILLLVTTFLCITGSAFADSDWKLVYANDRNGNITPECQARNDCGLDQLVSAIEAGAEVRISVYNHLMSNPTKYFQTLSQVWISPVAPIVGGKRHTPLTHVDDETIWATTSYYVDGRAYSTYSGGVNPIEEKENYFDFEWFVKK